MDGTTAEMEKSCYRLLPQLLSELLREDSQQLAAIHRDSRKLFQQLLRTAVVNTAPINISSMGLNSQETKGDRLSHHSYLTEISVLQQFKLWLRKSENASDLKKM